ncbi:DDE-type integrase/transposase/recombinase [Alloscardovia venturai]|uniref:DDE-type integrase/transposase/recombinase n=1 Tax=Alloscardovia venturai TaxID=1769421 RepID=A0ABW2Y6T6_9BIFI
MLDRQFKVDHPNKVWVSDVSEFRIGDKKLYLSPIMDLYNHKITPYSLSPRPTTNFTNESLQKAFNTEQPEPGILIHTNQGFQYQH